MISTVGKAYDYKGGVAIQTTRPPAENLSDEVTVLWQDRRQISPEQRRKAWALIGMLHLPLCWGVGGHHQELHQMGDRAFLGKYHLIPIPIDERIAKIHKLKGPIVHE